MSVDLVCLNDLNGASGVTRALCAELASTVQDLPLIGAEFGVAYGGGVQQIGRLWKACFGTIYGFDTFTGWPQEYADTERQAIRASFMDHWYRVYGRDGLAYDYQRAILDAEGLDNVILVPGLIDERSLDPIPYLHYALLDVDLVSVMRLCWQITRSKMIAGGYLCLHDALPVEHIPGLWGLYREILATEEYDLVGEYPDNMLVVLRRK